MKKLNNKGFLMVETLIVSVFVLTIFVLVYQNSVPMVGIYKARERYDDIDSVYNANLFRNLVIRDGVLYQELLTRIDNEGYIDITDCGVFDNELLSTCNTLKNMVGVTSEDKIYITNWDVSIEGEETGKSILTDSSLNRGLLDYIKYLNEQGQETSLFSYRLIMSRTVFHIYEEGIDYEEGEASILESEKGITYYANIGV